MWDRIELLMPADPVRGRRRADHRRTLEAIAWKYRTSSPWLKQWRGLAMRTDKPAVAYQAALHLAAILIWSRG